jgi:hypothetical protein
MPKSIKFLGAVVQFQLGMDDGEGNCIPFIPRNEQGQPVNQVAIDRLKPEDFGKVAEAIKSNIVALQATVDKDETSDG